MFNIFRSPKTSRPDIPYESYWDEFYKTICQPEGWKVQLGGRKQRLHQNGIQILLEADWHDSCYWLLDQHAFLRTKIYHLSCEGKPQWTVYFPCYKKKELIRSKLALIPDTPETFYHLWGPGRAVFLDIVASVLKEAFPHGMRWEKISHDVSMIYQENGTWKHSTREHPLMIENALEFLLVKESNRFYHPESIDLDIHKSAHIMVDEMQSRPYRATIAMKNPAFYALPDWIRKTIQQWAD